MVIKIIKILSETKLHILAFKNERILEIWEENDTGLHNLKKYSFTTFSGFLGPKMKEGDEQIPEGIYGIELLNPKSKYFLSMRLNYPNEFDLAFSKKIGINHAGNDIYIHGGTESKGCIAIGNENIADLYKMVEAAGKENVRVYIFPNDFRNTNSFSEPEMYKEKAKILYPLLKGEIMKFTIN